ncbi:MAG: DNA-directed RNA polymerase subunit beta [Coprobacillus sp.]|nr:DNA-directed RNA polymerase subunit beta [Coprobacillus sp.]
MNRDIDKLKRLNNDRVDYSSISGDLPLPNLVEIQTRSYNELIDTGLDEVFKESFPIVSYDEKLVIEYSSLRLGDPKHTILDCKANDLTYAAPLYVTLLVKHNDTGEIQESEVYMGDFPLMTSSGTFIINGAERVIVSQLVRSPGAYLSKESHYGREMFGADLIPGRGTWLQFETDFNKHLIFTRIDRQRKMSATVLLKGLLGVELSNDEKAGSTKEDTAILDLFGYNNVYLNETLSKDDSSKIKTSNEALTDIFKKMKPGEPVTKEGYTSFLYQKFMDPKRYSLGKAGRFKYEKKLSIYDRLKGRVLAEDLKDLEGNTVYPQGHTLTSEEVEDLRDKEFFENLTQVAYYSRLYNRKLSDNVFDDNGVLLFEKDHTLTPEDVKSLQENDYYKELENVCKIKIYPLKNNPVIEYVAPQVALVHVNKDLHEDIDFVFVNIVRVYTNEKVAWNKNNISTVVGTDLKLTCNVMSISDIFAIFSYLLNVIDGFGDTDDIDHLGNRRIRCVGELIQNQFRVGLAKTVKTAQKTMSVTDMTNVKPKALINPRPLTASIREFFASSQLSQFMDQTNPLAELTNKRRLSALGPGGLTRDRASSEVRDVHVSHYGRICPIETPEGQNVGLINNLSSYARVNKYGFIETPYREVDKEHCKVLSDAEHSHYLSADDEKDKYIAGANIHMAEDGTILDDRVIARYNGEDVLVDKEKVDYVDVSPKQIVSVATACIPFLENDDNSRALMGANMQRQALPLLKPSAPIVGTGMEYQIARDSGLAVVASFDGEVTYTDSKTIRVRPYPDNERYTDYVLISEVDGTVTKVDKDAIYIHPSKKGADDVLYLLKDETSVNRHPIVGVDTKVKKGEIIAEPAYVLQKFERSNNGTCINQRSIVHVGQKIKRGDIIADGPAMDHGDLALGQNVVIAFMPWNGYNYEDAVIMSERLVKDDTYTSIHIEKYELECRTIPKLGDEEITADVPNVSAEAKAHLDENGIITIGSEVKEGDILVGKVTPKGISEPTPEEKLLMAIFGEKTNEGKDASLRVPHGGAGIVIDVKVVRREGKNRDVELAPGVNEVVRVYIAQKRKISEGDKMSGRHGNKGVISKILPESDMPFLPDGTPIDIMLNPLGVPSRMNIGQILESHVGLALKELGYKIATPVFDGITNDEIFELMKKAGIDEDGKTVLYDGRTGERFDERINVGVMYMIKLVHMVDDKLHARATGPYSLVTQQPLGGKAQNGGQRFGEMEVWALEAYGAAHVLQEIITIKSDDRVGRRKTYEAIIKGNEIPKPGIPEAFRVLVKELQGLALDVKLLDQNGEEIDMDELAREEDKEERKVNASIRQITGEEEQMSAEAALASGEFEE